MPSITENILNIRHQVALFEQKYDRVQGSVLLLAVSKTQSAQKIIDAYSNGDNSNGNNNSQRDFAENYLQEALSKIVDVNIPELHWHFIGPIQSNKTKAIAENFDWVHSVDRLKIAQRLSQQRPSTLPPIKILLQVNVSKETSKSGTSLAELPELAEQVSKLPNLTFSGLMAIPAASNNFEQQRTAFRRLAEARDKLLCLGFRDCLELSMGMSRDYEAAIAEGATMIRVGTAIFGKRTA